MHHKINCRIFFLVLMISTLLCKINAQQTAVSINDFYTLNNHALQEKIFVHTDKDFYVAGEILWFKLYDVSADSLKPLDLSKVAYVEILNAQHKPVLQSNINLKNGSGNGSFYLTSSIASGNYIFRAYTNWMKNFGADNFFQKEITIVNTLTPVIKTVNKDSANYEIGFFPEGGDLVAGIESKVGFKATDNYGNGVGCTGNIADENNQTITSFSTLNFGMGSFYFTPLSNHTYHAVVKIRNKIITKIVPAAINKGYVMHIKISGEQVIVNVHSNENFIEPVYVIATRTNNISTALMQQTDNNGNATFIIKKNNLNAGITHLILLNGIKQPLCERLIFIKPQYMPLTVMADKNTYNARSKVNMNITAAGNGVNLSMAVYLLDTLQSVSSSNILNYTWLASELKGKIELPQYYFDSSNEYADSALENLLLTQGWSRFAKSSTQYSTTALHFIPEHEGHIIEGKVTDKVSGLPAKNVRVYASVPGLHYSFASAVSNDSGYVLFDIKDAYGAGELVVQTAKVDSTYHVEIVDAYALEESNLQTEMLNITYDELQQLSRHNEFMQVQNAFTINQLNSFAFPEIDSSAFYGLPDAKYKLDDYTRFNTMEEVLREYVHEINVRVKQGNYYLYAIDTRNHNVFDVDPLVLVDGVPLLDMNKVIAYNPLKIKNAEIVTKKFYANSLIANGILSYSTYKGDLDGFPFDPTTVELSYDGLQLQREFYSPQYNTAEQLQSRLPDYRNTLYWAPNITGNLQSSFYTSDIKGNYIVVVQGIDKDGNTGYNSTQFQVK